MRSQALSPHLIALPVAVALLVTSGSAFAQSVPERMVFQGRLVRADGAPETQPQDLRFSIYGQAQGGSALWTETHMGVVLTNGHYAVELGSATPLAGVFNGDARWMAVSLASQSELGPRLPISSAPYALRAGVAADAARLSGFDKDAFARADHGHTAATPSDSGFMSSGDKAKLDNVPTVFGDGLTANTNSMGQRRLEVSFGGNGSSTNVARSNHTHAPPSLNCTRETATAALDTGATATCASNQTVTGGGCEGVPYGNTNFTMNAVPVTNGYQCRGTNFSGPAPSINVTAHAICCRIQ